MLSGGADSYNMLVPLSECRDIDLWEEYKHERRNMAEDRANLLEINASASNQPCATFGIHKSLEAIHQMYQDGDALWVANMGKPTAHDHVG